jgi:hypothetical protein
LLVNITCDKIVVFILLSLQKSFYQSESIKICSLDEISDDSVFLVFNCMKAIMYKEIITLSIIYVLVFSEISADVTNQTIN